MKTGKRDENVQLKAYNTFGLDVIARRFVELCDEDDYSAVTSLGIGDGPFFVLGGGSNVIFLHETYEGLLLHPVNKGVKVIEHRDGCFYVEAQSGEVWDEFVDYCIAHGWYGLENLAGIPGTVGAAPVQNIGAYGKEAKDFIHRVHCFNLLTKEQMWLGNRDCAFGYRDSVFKHDLRDKVLIDRVQFRLPDTFVPDLSYKALSEALSNTDTTSLTAMQVAQCVRSIRDSKLPKPSVLGNVGSFFTNPVVSKEDYERIVTDNPGVVAFKAANGCYKLSAAWMIEQCGWKGREVDGVGVYEKQALVLVNRGVTDGSMVRSVAGRISKDVEARFGVALASEAVMVE